MTLQKEIDDAQVDTVERAAIDCARAKLQVKGLETKMEDARDAMGGAKERLLAFAIDTLADQKRLTYKVGNLGGPYPLELQLRRSVSTAKGRIYTPENQHRVDELQATMKALAEEIEKVPYGRDDHQVTSWAVWLEIEK